MRNHGHFDTSRSENQGTRLSTPAIERRSVLAILTYTSMVCASSDTAQLAEDPVVRRTSSSFDGRNYDTVITKSNLEMAPRWSADQDNPPLSVRAAEKKARDCIKRVVPKSEQWVLRRISLEPVGQDGWIYVVEFTAHQRGQTFIGGVETFAVPVLMNGSIPEPRISTKAGR
jgi:hypothetical protein